MPEEINTEGLQSRFREVIESFVALFEGNPKLEIEYPHHTLLFMKIASNLLSSNLLWSKGRFDEARTVLRSAYESLVLANYLTAFPSEKIRFERDSFFIDFQNHIALFLRKHSTYEELAAHYSKLPEDIKEQLPLKSSSGVGIITFDIQALANFYRGKFKPLSQQTRPMITKLVAEKKPNSDAIDEVSWFIYGTNSQVAHGAYHTLLKTFAKFPTDDDVLWLMKDCYRQSIFILKICIPTLTELIGNVDAGDMWKKALSLYSYLGYDLSQID